MPEMIDPRTSHYCVPYTSSSRISSFSNKCAGAQACVCVCATDNLSTDIAYSSCVLGVFSITKLSRFCRQGDLAANHAYTAAVQPFGQPFNFLTNLTIRAWVKVGEG
eukprot:5121140-Amphidinium_carterae.2